MVFMWRYKTKPFNPNWAAEWLSGLFAVYRVTSLNLGPIWVCAAILLTLFFEFCAVYHNVPDTKPWSIGAMLTFAIWYFVGYLILWAANEDTNGVYE